MFVPPFRSYKDLLSKDQVDLLKVNSHALFTAKKKATKGRYSVGDTFFIKASEEPQSIAEEYALAVFHWFTKGMYYDSACAGAEFWPLVLDEANFDEVAAHYDKDYAAESEGEDIYPLVGTVTYLSDYGAPTTFFDMLETSSRSPPCNVPRAWMSRVQSGKVVAFDGRFLHCAPGSLASLWGNAKANIGPRVTLLVNVWFHTPIDALRCPFIELPGEVGNIAFPNLLSKADSIPLVRAKEQDATSLSITLGTPSLHLECLVNTFEILATKAPGVEIQWEEGQSVIQKKRKKEIREKKQASRANRGKGKGKGRK